MEMDKEMVEFKENLENQLNNVMMRKQFELFYFMYVNDYSMSEILGSLKSIKR